MKKYFGKFTLFLVAWLVLMAFVAHLLTRMEIQRFEAGLKDHAREIAASIGNKLDANEAVLAGFAAFLLAVDQSDSDAVTRYAAAISDAYPHIYMLEVARRVPLAEQAAFEALLQKTWRPDFAIKDFPVLAHQPRKQTTGDDGYMAHPVHVPGASRGQRHLRPAPGNRRLPVSYTGARQGQCPAGRLACVLDVRRRQVIHPASGSQSSEQFARGERANLFGDTMTALLLIRTDRLLSLSASGGTAPNVQFDRAAE